MIHHTHSECFDRKELERTTDPYILLGAIHKDREICRMTACLFDDLTDKGKGECIALAIECGEKAAGEQLDKRQSIIVWLRRDGYLGPISMAMWKLQDLATTRGWAPDRYVSNQRGIAVEAFAVTRYRARIKICSRVHDAEPDTWQEEWIQCDHEHLTEDDAQACEAKLRRQHA